MSTKSLLVIVPTYGHYDFAAKAVRSALQAKNRFLDTYVVVIDDATPNAEESYAAHLRSLEFDFPQRFLGGIFLKENIGLTRVWNMGLSMAKRDKFEVACCANSDIIFAENWLDGVESAIRFGAHLVGPLTNAPGAKPHQAVQRHLKDYVLTDEQAQINATGAAVFGKNGYRSQRADINGFCMTALVRTWYDGKYDQENVFCPRNDFNSKGERNPTPTMTLNEDELQRRWRQLGLNSSIALGSFVFHYRAVTRGDRYKTPGAFRPT